MCASAPADSENRVSSLVHCACELAHMLVKYDGASIDHAVHYSRNLCVLVRGKQPRPTCSDNEHAETTNKSNVDEKMLHATDN